MEQSNEIENTPTGIRKFSLSKAELIGLNIG